MTVARHGRIPQRRIAETVAAELRERIFADDQYSFATQEQLVREFGVSHPSIREALRILETEGLVTVRRGKVGGANVHRPDEAQAACHLGLSLQSARVTLRDLAVGLQMLEPNCAEACASREDRAEVVVPALRRCVEMSEQAMNDGVVFTQSGRDFHRLIVSFTPNPVIRSAVGSYVALWSAQEQAWAVATMRNSSYPSSALESDVVCAHRRIVDDIEAGRPGEAKRLARAHLEATQAFIIEHHGDSVVNVSNSSSRRGRPSMR
nr:FCD domain-containing protein [Rhodococcus sp. USK13]